MEKSEREKLAEKRRLTTMKRFGDAKERFDKGIEIQSDLAKKILLELQYIIEGD